ncbi:MAG: hypothetical protein EAZ08_00350 [Cytophagales bacterium]|nr:MAG: hypothetical protein EAZ08_00350 [Cytophagales bacterium]
MQNLIENAAINDNTFKFEINMKHKNILQNMKKNQWLSFLIIPSVYSLKVLIISLFLVTGLVINSYKFIYANILLICIWAEFIFITPFLYEILYFNLIEKGYTHFDLQNFHNFSLLYFIDLDEINKWYVYCIRQFNLFEIIYFLFLAQMLNTTLKTKFWGRLKFILSTYGVALAIWILFIMLITIDLLVYA